MKIYLFLLLSISSFRNQKVSGNEMATKGPTEKNDELAWEGHHRVLQRMLFFSRIAN